MWFTVLMTIHQKPERSVVYHIETRVDGSGASSRAFHDVAGVFKDGERHVNLLMRPDKVFLDPIGNMPSNTQVATNQIDAANVRFDERGMCFMDTGLQATVGNNLPYFCLFHRNSRCYLRALATSNAADVSFTVSYVDVSIKSDSAPKDPKWAYPLAACGGAKATHVSLRPPSVWDALFVQHGRYTALVAAMSAMILWRCLRMHARRRVDDEPAVHPPSLLPRWAMSWIPYSLCVGTSFMSPTVRALAGMVGCVAWYVQTRLVCRE